MSVEKRKDIGQKQIERNDLFCFTSKQELIYYYEFVMESHCYILQAVVATNDVVVCVIKSYFSQTGIVSNDVSTT